MLRIADLGTTFGISGGSVFRQPWKEFAEVVEPVSLSDFAKQAKEIDLVIFGGGSDIHPEMYKHKNVASHVGGGLSSRDVKELAAYKICLQLKIPVFGICRGAQLACIMAGGYLIQDISNHAGASHQIIDVATKKLYTITSAHHQMMHPYGIPHKMIAQMPERISKRYDFYRVNDNVSISVEPEIVYFPDINSLAVQGHPEFMNPNDETCVYVRTLVNQYLLNGKGKDV